MKETYLTHEINSHINGGENARVKVVNIDHALNLVISLPCYGTHWTEVTITLDNSANLRELGFKMIQAANEAERFFKENP